MHTLTAKLRDGQELTASEIEYAVEALVSVDIADDAKADFLKTLREKGESAAEIAAFVQSLLRRAVDPGIDPAQLPGPVIDVCGTGGDQLELFNVSTTSMFILAAGGAVVVKHGNRGITSKCGGADVLEALGIRIDLQPDALRACVEAHGLGFVFAPNYHPAFKMIAPVRKKLAEQGIATVFNLLGPLLNPARPPYQLVGVFDRAALAKYAEVLRLLGRKNAWVVNGSGADEILPFGVTEIIGSAGHTITLDPAVLGIAPGSIEELRGGDRETNAGILTGILDGSIKGAKRDTVLLNAAAGFVVTGLAAGMADGVALARGQIDSGRAIEKLRALQGFKL